MDDVTKDALDDHRHDPPEEWEDEAANRFRMWQRHNRSARGVGGKAVQSEKEF